MPFLQLYTLFGRAAHVLRSVWHKYKCSWLLYTCCWFFSKLCSNKFSLRSHQEMGMRLRVSSTTRRIHYNIGLEGWHYVASRYSDTKIDSYITFGGTACGFKEGVSAYMKVSTKQKVFSPASTLVVAFLSWCLNTHVISPYFLLYIWSSCYLPSL